MWPYDPAPETAELGTSRSRYDLFIDGDYRAPKSGKYFETINPATGGKLADVALAGEADVDAAYRAAGKPRSTTIWGRMPGQERGKYLFPHRAPLCRIAPANSRWPRRSTAANLSKSRATSTCLPPPRTFFYHAGWADKLDYAFPRPAPARTRSG